MLANISDFKKEEVADIVQKDMKVREENNFEKYFNDVLIVLRKSQKNHINSGNKKQSKKGAEEYIARIAHLEKDPAGLLFEFNDNLNVILRGFTIDQRIFYNMLRKMIIIKFNNEKIWSRQFYSQDLKKIYLVIKPIDSAIKNRAQVV